MYQISAGKFRRYHSQSWLSRLGDIETNLKNCADFFKFLIGTVQAVLLLRRLRPDVVFIKGGFVGVPVGLGCRLLNIPYITHDSDTIPGLANRLIGAQAAMHAVGMPPEFYSYPKDKTRYVGIPVGDEYQTVTAKQKAAYRHDLGVSKTDKVLCITGGSLGAVRLNHAVMKIVPELLDQFSTLHVFHQTGEQDEELYGGLSAEARRRIVEVPFVDNLEVYTGAADVVIARAGATTIAELAIQQKAVVLVPNPQLTGGHQTKNAEHLAAQGAILVLAEQELAMTAKATTIIADLLASSGKQQNLAKNIQKLAKPDAADEIARLIVEIGAGTVQ